MPKSTSSAPSLPATSTASRYVDESQVRYGERQGPIVLGFGEDLMDVLNSPGFAPREFGEGTASGAGVMIPLIRQHHTELDALCRRFGVRRLDLFGSAARGDFSPEFSDLDFVVQFAEPREVGYAFRYLRFAESLEMLFERRVDLLTENMVRDAAFRDSVEQVRQEVYSF